MKTIPIFFILFLTMTSCSKPASKWSKSKYKFMVWEFAGALERNYNKWDTNPKFDKNGNRIAKSIYKNKKSSPNKSYDYYHKNNNNGAKYDPNTHEGYEF